MMLDFVALFIGTYHLFAIDNSGSFITPLNAFAVVALFIYGLLILHPRGDKLKKIRLTKLGLILVIILYTTLAALIGQIYDRSISEPHLHTHDHALQIEAALNFLQKGKNPYTENYTQTPMAKWNSWKDNPALYHLPSLPTHLYVSIPFYAANIMIFPGYDQRVVHIAFFFVALIAAYMIFDRDISKRLALIIIGLNPVFSPFFITGLDDIVFLAMLLVAIAFLRKKHFQLSMIFVALAVTSKHSAWFIVPFYGLYLWQTGYFKTKAVDKILPSVLIVAASILPFIVWDARSFWEDIYLFPAGNLATSYPIKGMGISPILINHGVIENKHTYFPFVYIQLLLLPVLIFQLVWQKRYQSVGRLVLNYAILLWGFWFLSRFFNDSYAGVLAVLIPIGALLMYEERLAGIRTHEGPAIAAPNS